MGDGRCDAWSINTVGLAGMFQCQYSKCRCGGENGRERGSVALGAAAAFFYSERLYVCASQGAWNASGQTGNISLLWSFVLLNSTHLSQQRRPENNKR